MNKVIDAITKSSMEIVATMIRKRNIPESMYDQIMLKMRTKMKNDLDSIIETVKSVTSITELKLYCAKYSLELAEHGIK